jgi:hypothetical protein
MPLTENDFVYAAGITAFWGSALEATPPRSHATAVPASTMKRMVVRSMLGS